MKLKICSMLGALGSVIASLFGGFDYGLVTLLIFMGVDYLSGLVVAGVFHSSNKSKNGALESHAGWKGICKKCMTLLFVLIAHRLDMLVGANYIRDAVIIGFSVNELLSITENAGLMGLPVPAVITKMISVLQSKVENTIESEGEEDGIEN